MILLLSGFWTLQEYIIKSEKHKMIVKKITVFFFLTTHRPLTIISGIKVKDAEEDSSSAGTFQRAGAGGRPVQVGQI